MMKGIGFVLLIAIFLSVAVANLTFAVSTACTATISNPTGGFYDVGQYVSFTASESNCVSPFTYNIIIKPYPSGNVIRNELLTGQTANSVTYTFQLTPSDANLNEMANVIVTDSGSNTVGSANSPYFNVRNSMTTPIISPSSASIDKGNPVTLTSSLFYGSLPYSTSIYSSPTSTCNQESTLVQQETGMMEYGLITFKSNLVYPTSNTYYCEFVTDNSTSAYSFAGSLPADTGNPYGVAISTNGAYAYIVNEYSNNVVIINTATNTVVNSITSGFNEPYGVAFSPSGTYAYVTNYGSDNIVIINTATNTVTGAITPGLNSPQGMAFSPSGTYAYVTNTGSNNVIIINTEAATTNSINSEITVNTGPQISNPYSGGSTGYFGSNSTLTSSTTSTISSSSTSTILPVTTITQIIASSGTTKACNDTSGYTINYPSLNATIKIAPGIRGCFNVNVTNSTSQSKTLNRSVITALNYTVNNTNVSTEAILHYPCSISNSDVAPFILRNGTWQEITPFTLNVAACTVEFAVPSDPVIALLNTNATSTILTTAATTAVQTSVPVTSVPTNTGMILEILIILIIIIIAVALFLYFRRKS